MKRLAMPAAVELVEQQDELKFPWYGVITNSLVIGTNAFALFQCFPYAGYMVVWMGKAKTVDEAGFYSGFLVAGFMIGRSSTSLLWGIATDILGRKPVIAIGCTAMIVFQIMFGLAKTFEVALASRILLGVFNGLVATSKTVASEIVPRDRRDWQAKSMSWVSAGVSLATLIGPTVGGWLSSPAEQYPGTIFDNDFLKSYPYFLPNLIAALFAFVALVLTLLVLPETLERPTLTAQEKEAKARVSYVATAVSLIKNNCKLMLNKKIALAIFAYCIQSFISICMYEIFPLWLMASKGDSGKGMQMSLGLIGSIQSINGAVLLAYQSLLFPQIAKRVKPIRFWVLAGYIMFPFVLFMPFTSQFGAGSAGNFVLAAILRSIQVVLDMSIFTSSFMLINNSCDGAQRGSVNGLAMTLASVTKAIGPIIFSVLFAWSVTNGLSFPLSHHLTFFIIAILYALQSFAVGRYFTKDMDVMKKEGENLVTTSSVEMLADNEKATKKGALV